MARFWTSALASLIAVSTFAQSAAGATIWSEGIDGDLSGNRLAPTSLALALGTNTIIASTVVGDVDYFSFTVPAGTSVSQMVLSSFTSIDDLAFLAIQTGAIITETTGAPNVANLLGWMHPSAAFVGTDILDDLGLGAGAIGFAPPLLPNTYSFWMQQTQPDPVGYSYDIALVPEPSAAALLALGLGGLALARSFTSARRSP